MYKQKEIKLREEKTSDVPLRVVRGKDGLVYFVEERVVYKNNYLYSALAFGIGIVLDNVGSDLYNYIKAIIL
jgi:hypothetical protein